MEKDNAVGWFEIPVIDMERAKEFYGTVLQCELEHLPDPTGGDMEMFNFPMEMEGKGAAGALVKYDQAKPSMAGTRVYFSVDTVDNAVGRVEENGGRTLMPKMSIGEHGFIAVVADTEGNTIGLHAME